MVTMIKACPKNKQFFLRLKAFCRKVLHVCDGLGVTPAAHGSLAYFAYTKQKIAVNDIDLLVPEASFRKIIAVLSKKNIRYSRLRSLYCIMLRKLLIDFCVL